MVLDLRNYSPESGFFFSFSRSLIDTTEDVMPPSRKSTSSSMKKEDGSPCVKVIRHTNVKTHEKMADFIATGNWFLSVLRHTR